MRRIILIFVFAIISPAISFGQEIAVKRTIRSEFSAPVIRSYQEQSKEKIRDLYQYLEWLTFPENSPELKQQIRESIYALFVHKNSTVADFTSESRPLLSLPEFLDRIELLKQTSFTILEISPPSSLHDDYWLQPYILEIRSESQTFSITLEQKVYFKPEYKSFGSVNKEVWHISLGPVK